MNYAAMPGFGDPATWGGRSPEPQDYEGPVFFTTHIGLGEGKVTVMGTTNGHELEAIHEVLTENGGDILPYLDAGPLESIRNHFERWSTEIIKASTQPEMEGPQ